MESKWGLKGEEEEKEEEEEDAQAMLKNPNLVLKVIFYQ